MLPRSLMLSVRPWTYHGHADQARALAQDWLARHPDDQPMRLRLAALLAAAGDDEAAIAGLPSGVCCRSQRRCRGRRWLNMAAARARPGARCAWPSRLSRRPQTTPPSPIPRPARCWRRAIPPARLICSRRPRQRAPPMPASPSTMRRHWPPPATTARHGACCSVSQTDASSSRPR
jgi:hypothetical protein